MALIMIADDNQGFVGMLQAYLESRGHQVVTVADGFAASVKAQEWKPQLIIMDIQMPSAYGTASYTSLEMAGLTKTTPVIFVSAIPPEKAKALVPSTPKTRFLPKPLDLPALEKAIAELLGRPL